MSEKVILTSSQPASQCLVYDKHTYGELLSGSRSMVLVVSQYRPTVKNAGLKISIIDDNKATKVAIHHPAVYPSRSFNVAKGDAPMRFHIPLNEHEKKPGIEETCLQVAFDEEGDSGGFAEIYLTIMPVQ